MQSTVLSTLQYLDPLYAVSSNIISIVQMQKLRLIEI